MTAESNRARLLQELTVKSPDMSVRGGWIMFEKAVPHDMVVAPHTARMFIGQMPGTIVARIVSSSPSGKEGKPQVYAFDMTLPSGGHGLEIQYVSPSEREAQQYATEIGNPEYPLAYLRDVLTLKALDIEGEGEESVRLLYNGILEALLPEKLDLNKACRMIQKEFSVDKKEALEIIESLKRARVKATNQDDADATPFFDPALY